MGVGVALLVALGVAAVAVVIAVVLVLKRRRVDGKAVDEMRNGENTMDNPVYTGERYFLAHYVYTVIQYYA